MAKLLQGKPHDIIQLMNENKSGKHEDARRREPQRGEVPG